MSSADAKKKAKQYLEKQAQIMGKYGTAPKLKGDAYKAAVAQTTRTFERLSILTSK